MNRWFKEKDHLRALKYESIFSLYKGDINQNCYDIHIKNGAAVK